MVVVYIAMAYRVMAEIVMAYTVMADRLMACMHLGCGVCDFDFFGRCSQTAIASCNIRDGASPTSPHLASAGAEFLFVFCVFFLARSLGRRPDGEVSRAAIDLWTPHDVSCGRLI